MIRFPVAAPRLCLSSTGKVVYTLKTLYRDGTRACPALWGMTWAQRLKRVFNIDIETCGRCGGSLKVIAWFEDQNVIDNMLAHLLKKEQGIPIIALLTSPPGHHLKHYRFSLERARGSRIPFNSIRSARKPLKKSGSAPCVRQFSNGRM